MKIGLFLSKNLQGPGSPHKQDTEQKIILLSMLYLNINKHEFFQGPPSCSKLQVFALRSIFEAKNPYIFKFSLGTYGKVVAKISMRSLKL